MARADHQGRRPFLRSVIEVIEHLMDEDASRQAFLLDTESALVIENGDTVAIASSGL